MSGAAIEARNISRLFRLGAEDIWAVKDVSLTVEPGEFLALVGRSGSGKTTLLNIIGGLDRPSEGEVYLDGERVDTMSEGQLNELRRKTIGVIFQSFGLLPLLSAQENVEMPLRIAGYRPGERGKRASRVLDMVGLGRRRDHRPYELSGGEQQRVAIARALATQPRLILADEPTGELDSSTAVAVFGLMRELAASEGITIVTCTHDRLVMEQADRIEELADGHLVDRSNQQVWERVRHRERSPFAARNEDSETAIPKVSSLVGADSRVFKRYEEEDGHHPDDDDGLHRDNDGLRDDESATEAPEEQDVNRWRRPQ